MDDAFNQLVLVKSINPMRKAPPLISYCSLKRHIEVHRYGSAPYRSLEPSRWAPPDHLGGPNSSGGKSMAWASGRPGIYYLGMDKEGWREFATSLCCSYAIKSINRPTGRQRGR